VRKAGVAELMQRAVPDPLIGLMAATVVVPPCNALQNWRQDVRHPAQFRLHGVLN
jgi:hypothetical protein